MEESKEKKMSSPNGSEEDFRARVVEPLPRLPTLGEVLGKQTASPVDLFSFYIYMRDQQRSVDYLDFWLDVSQHLELCRHYVKDLRRSVLYETPELDKAGSQRSSRILDNFDTAQDRKSISSQRSQGQAISAYLRSESHDQNGNNGEANQHSSANATGSAERLKNIASEDDTNESVNPFSDPEQPPRPSFMTSNFGDGSSPGQNSSPGTQVKRGDIRASAEKILYTYVLPGSEREIVLPRGIQQGISEAIEEHGRDDPEVFDPSKDYVFQAMERDAFPGFLQKKALGNLVPPSAMTRLIVGLVALFAGFWTSFTLIFLDASRATRCWNILPFSIAVYLLFSHQYNLDPIIALAGYSEYTFFKFVKMKEPFVLKLLRRRALVQLSLIILSTVAIVCLFVFVPGKRL